MLVGHYWECLVREDGGISSPSYVLVRDGPMSKASQIIERAVERATGVEVESLRQMPIDERRRLVEQKAGRPLRIVSRFRLIGRGNIMRDRLISHEEVEAVLRRALNN
jgi:KaiC/GvpD/RAD55 family RecA-like ATPase